MEPFETVEILRFNSEGEGVGVLPGGKTVFVPFAAAGETAEISILHEKKNLAFGRLEKIVKPSPARTEPVCPVYGRCGGCSLMHIRYDKQLEIKKDIVRDALKKIGGTDFAPRGTVPSPGSLRYRNKAALPVAFTGGKLRIGFYAKDTHDVINIDSCPVHGDWLASVIAIFREYITTYKIPIYDGVKKTGLARHIVARELSGAVQICVVINGAALPRPEALIALLRKKFENFSLLLNINTVHNNVIMGARTVALYGGESLAHNTCGINYSVRMNSFLQINTAVAGKMYLKALELSGVTGADTVIDAYSGIGILTALFAKKARKAYGMEIIPAATADAGKLMEENGITNAQNITADCGKSLPGLIEKVKKEYCAFTRNGAERLSRDNKEDAGTGRLIVILDPPRKGCDNAVTGALIQTPADKIIYISCDPATLARDLKLLLDSGVYDLTYAEPYDMFPQTANVETLVVLSKKL